MLKMATSAFKSTSKRTTIGGSSSEDPSTTSRSHRRSRSLSRFSRPEVVSEAKGKFVDTVRGLGECTEISLDDLAIEFFSLRNENESHAGTGEREDRSVSHCRGEGEGEGGGSEIGRWASHTASSRRRGRSVSRSSEGDSKGYIVSSGSGGGDKSVTTAEAGSRRRRSLSVARYHISDSESEVDHSQNPSNRAIVKGPIRGRSQIPSSRKPTALNNPQPEITLNKNDQLLLHDGYSSHSSALTDDESKTLCIGRNRFEKTIQAVYTEKAELHTENAVNSGLYEAMRKELRYAVEEIRTELNQAMGRDQAALSNGNFLQVDKPEILRDFSVIRNSYTTKLEQSEKRKQDLLTEILLEEQRGRDLSKIVRDLLPGSKTSSVARKPSRARKRSSDKSRASKQLSEEAEKYFVDFISNVEDTDISSFDGERSDGSSTVGGTRKARDSSIRAEAESYQSPVEMEGVLLPWLKWETIPDGSLSGKNKAQTPVTPKALQWDSEKDGISLNDSTNHSTSSHGSWSPVSLNSTPLNGREYSGGKTRQFGDELVSHFNTDEYLKLENSGEVLFEMYKERNRIKSGGLLLCNSVF